MLQKKSEQKWSIESLSDGKGLAFPCFYVFVHMVMFIAVCFTAVVPESENGDVA